MKGNWIWYPGDFEIHHGLLQNFQREERGYDWPAYWNIDDCSRNVHFYKKVVLSEEESFVVYGRGQGYVSVNGKKYRLNKPIICSAGEAEIDVFIGNLSGLPCIYADGKTIFTDSSWTVNRMYGEMVPAGICDLYQDKNQDPNQIYFNKNHVLPYEVREVNNGVLFDFHKEINGTVIFHKNTVFPVMLCYGESDVEALDVDNCYYRQLVKNADETIRKRAFRYIFVPNHKEKNISLEAVHEYLHKEVRGKFNSSDHLLNDIWKTAEDTFLVCCGLLIPEGAKRDRWLWAGDAYQSFFINQYLQADASLNQRMIIAMRGNDPIKQHINTIVDYSLLWIISIRNQYMMDGDLVFLSFIYPKMKSMMDYCIAQTDPSGFIIERPGDWIFIDWADIDKEGPVCAEQMLLLEAEKCVDYCGKELHVTDDDYEIKAESLLHNINNYFWDEEKHAYIDSFVSHKRNVTRHANILAVLFDIANENQRCDICQNVLFNEQIPEITTPYFKFFELDG